MSGLYISDGTVSDGKRWLSALSFAPETWEIATAIDGLVIGVNRLDSPKIWSPAQDMHTGVYVAVCGRLAFEEENWARSEKLPFEGGLSCRLILNEWLHRQSDNDFTLSLNGAACVVIVDPRDATLHVITDRMGLFPLYVTQDDDLAICSHPDILADSLNERGKSVEIDWVSIAECLGTASSVHPHTYYKSIKQLDAATHYTWNLIKPRRKIQAHAYWEPAYLHTPPDQDEYRLVSDLADALKNAVKRRTNPRLGTTAIFLSGGADSRLALFGAQDPSATICFTLYDEPNAELDTAKRLAAAAGATHVSLRRDPDYYAASAEEAVRISGGMWSIADAHFSGLAESIKTHNIGTILSGCYADYLFKGIAFNRKPRKLFGKNLPLYNLAPFNYNYYHGQTLLREPWQKQVSDRMESRFCGEVLSHYPDNALRIENLRVRPLIREANAAGRLGLWRVFPWDPLFADKEVLDVYGRIPVKLKLNGILFGKAVGKVIGEKGRRIPNNNYGAPVHATELSRAFYFQKASLGRKIQRLLGKESLGNSSVTSGSWPNWSVYIVHSKTVARMFGDVTADERRIFEDILGFDPWSLSIQQWADHDVMLFMRFLTIKIWLRQRGLVN